MKTIKQNNKQVQETILKSIFAVIIIAALSFTVNGQNFWASVENSFSGNSNSGVYEINNSTDGYFSSSINALIQVESESELELEKWMVSNNYFGTFINVEEEMEQPLELENWMTYESFFSIYGELTAIESEEDLELETWMTNGNYFKISNVCYAVESENSLAVEDWMLNTKHFEVTNTGLNSNKNFAYAANKLPF